MSYEEKASKIEKHPTGWIFAILVGACMTLTSAIGILWRTDKKEERERMKDITEQLKGATEIMKQMSANEQENNRRRDSLERENKRITDELAKFIENKNKTRK